MSQASRFPWLDRGARDATKQADIDMDNLNGFIKVAVSAQWVNCIGSD